jgi:hypothetical protein
MLAMAFACSNEEESSRPKSTIEIIQTSFAFRSLGVSESELDMNNIVSETTPAGKSVLMLSFKNSGNKIMNLLDDKGLITVSTLVSVESSINTDDYFNAFDSKRFEGKISFLSSTGEYFGMIFKESKIANYFIATDMIKGGHDNARTEGCNGWTEKGGPLDCAGASLDSDGPFSKADCYLSGFLPCMAWKVMDCWWGGCVMVAPTGYGVVIVNGVAVSQVIPKSAILDPSMVVKTPLATRTTSISPIIFQ